MSLKTWTVTGASAEPSRAPSCGTPPKSSWASSIPAMWTMSSFGFWVEMLTIA